MPDGLRLLLSHCCSSGWLLCGIGSIPAQEFLHAACVAEKKKKKNTKNKKQERT